MSRINNITLLGGTGFVGTQLTVDLAKHCDQVTVLTRHKQRCRDLQVLTNVDIQECDVHNEDALAEALKDANVVINLVGILNQSHGSDDNTFEAAHAELTRKVVEAVSRSSVSNYLHMSSLGADANDGSSEYLRSKGRAVDILQEGELDLTVFCPSVIFGNGDGLFTRFANLLQAMPVMPLACPDSRFAPVYVGDVATQIVQSINDPETFGQSYNLCGPDIMTLREIVEYTAEVLDVNRPIIGLPNGLAKAQAFVMEMVPGKPFSRDNYQSLQIDSICESCDTPAPTSIKKIVPTYLGKMNRQSRLQHYRELARRDTDS